jgi:hypothetical protein
VLEPLLGSTADVLDMRSRLLTKCSPTTDNGEQGTRYCEGELPCGHVYLLYVDTLIGNFHPHNHFLRRHISTDLLQQSSQT